MAERSEEQGLCLKSCTCQINSKTRIYACPVRLAVSNKCLLHTWRLEILPKNFHVHWEDLLGLRLACLLFQCGIEGVKLLVSPSYKVTHVSITIRESR